MLCKPPFRFSVSTLCLGLLMLSVTILLGVTVTVSAGQTFDPQPGKEVAPTTQPAAIAAAPDLVITGITLIPPNPILGGTADIEVVVKNQGDAATSGGFNLYLYVEPIDIPPTQSTPYTSVAGYYLSLPSGGSFKYTRTGQVFTKVPPVVYAWVDPPWENKVAESNENNNLFPQVTGNPDAYEEDDTCATAKQIAPDGTIQDHNLFRQGGVDDVDWIKFDGVGGVTYEAEATAVGANASLSLDLMDSCSGQPSFGGAKMKFTAPADGPYYFRVSSTTANYGPDNAYKFKITSDSNCASLLEPDNACAASGDLALNTAQTHTFCTQGDVDWMRFAVTPGTQYRVVSANVGPKANAKLALFMSCDDATSTANGQSFEFTAPSAGNVYIKAEPMTADAYGAGTDYTVKTERMGADGCTEDSFEQDDNPADAKAITAQGSPQTRNTCPAGDSDWVKVTLNAGTNYTVETLNLASAADTTLCLYASNGDQIVCDDDGGAGKGSRLIWSPSISADYLLRISDASTTVAGNETKYDLRVFPGTCQPDAAEEDNSRDAARVITSNSTVMHNFCPSRDEDWAAFSAAGGTSYIIETTDPGPESDTIIELYDADGNFLQQNDDHTPGTTSQVVLQPNNTANFFIKVRPYNPAYFGAGTEYGFRISPGTVTPTPTATAVPTPTATPTANPSSVRTLILVNRTRLTQLYGDSQTTQVMDKLNALAQHAQVRGDIIRLDNNAEVSAAYAAWIADQGSVEKANQVTTAIRNVVSTNVQQRGGLEYLVLVGDDRALPMRRILDTTPRTSENSYTHSDANNPVGVALKANYFLSDDYIADREPTVQQGHEIFIPDLAVGRLIETPDEMIGQIDAFLASPVTIANNVLVTGYDFVQDVATEDCADWRTDFDPAMVDCSLIGDSWTGQAFRALQLRTASPFRTQSISGHAAHYLEGAAQGNSITAQDIANAALDLRGGLIYTPGCHAGLNVPPNNADGPLDLAQAFVGKGANYIGNTGYGWGMKSMIGLSEKVIRLFTRALLKGTQSSMGKALATAKALYYQQDQDLSAYDEKVMQQVIFYGLPMYELTSGAVLGTEEEFPGVTFDPELPIGSLGETGVITGSVAINFRQAENLTLSGTGDGDYYALNGSIHDVPGQPVQALHFGDVSANQLPARGALLLGATFELQHNFNPAIAVPLNEYDTSQVEPALPNPLGLYPPMPVSVQHVNDRSSLVTQLSQYDAANKDLRLMQDLQATTYYSISSDQVAPEATVIDGISRVGSNMVLIKVGAVDSSGVQRVVVSYIQDINQNISVLRSMDLKYDATAQKWTGWFRGDTNSRYLVQLVDAAGNITTATNKGQYYKPGQVQSWGRVSQCVGNCLFLPVVKR